MTDTILITHIDDIKQTILSNRLTSSMLITDEYLNINPEEIHKNIIKRQLASEFAKAILDKIEPTENEVYRSGAGYKNIRRFDAQYVMLNETQYTEILNKLNALQTILRQNNLLSDWTPENGYIRTE